MEYVKLLSNKVNYKAAKAVLLLEYLFTNEQTLILVLIYMLVVFIQSLGNKFSREHNRTM
jgi:hypothetical protein